MHTRGEGGGPNRIFFFFWLSCEACGILVPWPGIEPGPLAVKAQSLTTGRPRNSQNFSCLVLKCEFLLHQDHIEYIFPPNFIMKICEHKKNLKELYSKQLYINTTFILFFFFWPCHVACGILIPQPGMEIAPPAVEAWSLLKFFKLLF